MLLGPKAYDAYNWQYTRSSIRFRARFPSTIPSSARGWPCIHECLQAMDFGVRKKSGSRWTLSWPRVRRNRRISSVRERGHVSYD